MVAKYKITGDNADFVKKVRQSKDELKKLGFTTEEINKLSSKAWKSQSQAIGGTTTSMKSFIGAAAAIASVIVAVKAVGKAFTFVKGQIRTSILAVQQQEKVNKDLEFSLLRMGVNAKKVMGELLPIIDEIAAKTGISDEEQLGVLSKLNLFTNDYRKSMELLAPVMGLSIAKGRDYNAIIDAVGKAIIGQKDGLKRYGIELDDVAFKQDKFAAIMDAIKPFALALDIDAQRLEKQITRVFTNPQGDIRQALFGAMSEEFTKALQGISPEAITKLVEDFALIGEALREPVKKVLDRLVAFTTVSSELAKGEKGEAVTEAAKDLFGISADKGAGSSAPADFQARVEGLKESVLETAFPSLRFLRWGANALDKQMAYEKLKKAAGELLKATYVRMPGAIKEQEEKRDARDRASEDSEAAYVANTRKRMMDQLLETRRTANKNLFSTGYRGGGIAAFQKEKAWDLGIADFPIGPKGRYQVPEFLNDESDRGSYQEMVASINSVRDGMDEVVKSNQAIARFLQKASNSSNANVAMLGLGPPNTATSTAGPGF